MTKTINEIPKNKLKKKVLDYLEGNRLMTIATTSKNKPWANTVFFAYDKSFNFFFYSKDDTIHVHNIIKSKYVAAAINQDWGRAGFVKGIQLAGRANKVGRENYKKYYNLFKKRYPWAEKYPDHNLYIIRPSKIYYIDHKLFGHFFRVRII